MSRIPVYDSTTTAITLITEKTEIYVPPPPPETEEEMFKSIEAGINFDKYENIPVEVSGDNPPKQGISRYIIYAFSV